jgi:hypothetical protein
LDTLNVLEATGLFVSFLFETKRKKKKEKRKKKKKKDLSLERAIQRVSGSHGIIFQK